MSTAGAILVVNPGSTSTKLAIGNGAGISCSATIRHSSEDLGRFSAVWDQFAFRLEECRTWARDHRPPAGFAAVAATGGLLRPIEGGVFRVSESMLQDARANLQGEHASNLGCALAQDLAADEQVPAFIVDPVSVDEFEPLASYSGHPLIRRRSLSHALNIHAAARKASGEFSVDPATSSFIVAHLGGGISIAPVRAGRIIDVNDAASDGPFSAERTGGLPLQPLISICFSGASTEQNVRSMVMGRGGLVAYLGTNSLDEIERRIQDGDNGANEVLEAMAYQIAKEIGAMATVLRGDLHAIVMTGGMAHSKRLVGLVSDRVRFLAPIFVVPGEDEMHTLVERVLGVLSGREPAKEY